MLSIVYKESLMPLTNDFRPQAPRKRSVIHAVVIAGVYRAGMRNSATVQASEMQAGNN
jgi:hypothetical protein